MPNIYASFCEDERDGVRCLLCPRQCYITEGRSGYCLVRGVMGGDLFALGYGCISSSHLDPIEKKPLNEFHPGSMIYSIGGWGCNLGCSFCQNWSISQQFEETVVQYPDSVIESAMELESIGIAYTYNEPLISYEFVYECSVLARVKGLVNVLVTNGYINPAPASEILPYIDALNIDIKSIDPAFYKQYCYGELQPVLDFAVQAVQLGCHVELTNLIIPGLNDDNGQIAELASWIRDNLGPDIPLHLSAYYPQYKMTVARTPSGTMLRARSIAESRLNSVYLGNMHF